MFGMGGTDFLVVGLVALLLFGKRLPEVGRGLGRSISEFKKGMREGETESRLPAVDGVPRSAASPETL